MSRFSNFVRFAGKLGGYSLARQLCCSQPRMLMYHRFSEQPKAGYTTASIFEEQVCYIKRYYNPMTAADLARALFIEKKVPEHAVVITVDDGYLDFYEIAYPILKRHGVPATFYATSGFVDDRLWLWPDKITWLLEQVSVVQAPFAIGHVSFDRGALDAASKKLYWSELGAHLLSVDDNQKHKDICTLSEKFGIRLPETAPDGYQSVSWGQLQEIAESGIEVGGHTVTHPSLGRVTRAQAEKEIQGCMDEIREHLGDSPRTFCYPNGTPSDFQSFLPEIIAEAGFIAATVAFPDARGVGDRYALRRHVSGDDMFQFYKSVSGVEFLGHKVRGSRVAEML